jgi:DNA-binding HxlR family transcriptional regulator
LKELENHGIIKKNVISNTPLRAEYMLTHKGQALNKIMYDLALFSYDYYSKDIFEKTPPSRNEMAKVTADIFNIHKDSV